MRKKGEERNDFLESFYKKKIKIKKYRNLFHLLPSSFPPNSLQTRKFFYKIK